MTNLCLFSWNSLKHGHKSHSQDGFPSAIANKITQLANYPFTEYLPVAIPCFARDENQKLQFNYGSYPLLRSGLKE
jgi:hypothetical protein